MIGMRDRQIIWAHKDSRKVSSPSDMIDGEYATGLSGSDIIDIAGPNGLASQLITTLGVQIHDPRQLLPSREQSVQGEEGEEAGSEKFNTQSARGVEISISPHTSDSDSDRPNP